MASLLRPALRAGGGVAAGAAVALCAAKVTAPPENGNRRLWLQKRTYRADSDSSTIPAGEAAALAALAAAKVPLTEVHDAARTRWNGVEHCLETAALRGEGHAADMIARLRAAGMLQSAQAREIVPETRSTYAADIGSAAPTYLGRPSSAPRLGAESLDGALNTLREDGIAILTNVVSAPDVQHLRQRLHMVTAASAGPSACPREVPTYEVAAAARGAAKPVEPSFGRRHFLIRGTELGEKEVMPLLAPLMPLVYRYFSEHRPDLPPGSTLEKLPAASGTPAASSSLAPSFFISECQVLVSDPDAVAQIWHKDNRQPGLTVILPLTDVDDQVGPTHVLPGTHRLFGGGFAGFKHAASALYQSAGAIAAAPLGPGSAFVYDGRLMHRGCANTSFSKCRVVIVVRIDCSDTPPPGATVMQTSYTQTFGRVLQYIGALYTALPLSSSGSSTS